MIVILRGNIHFCCMDIEVKVHSVNGEKVDS